MKKIISVFIITAVLLSSLCAYALNLDKAYEEFKTIHPDFINSLVDSGVEEETIISFISDVYDYLMEIDSYTPVTKANFEEKAIKAIIDVSSRTEYLKLQDTLFVLYPNDIKQAIIQGTISKQFQPLVNTVKQIFFDEEQAHEGSFGNNTSPETPVKPTSKFSDVDSSHWAFSAICSLADKFILSGYLDGTFKPESNITRAEFAKIIISATTKLDSESASSFTDVSDDVWYYPYVSTAYKLGYITGYPDGSFRPDDNITRADICVIVNRVLSADKSVNVTKFQDDNLIPTYAKDSVYALSSKGIINGFSDNTFAPLSYATRAQTSKIIYTAFFNE